MLGNLEGPPLKSFEICLALRRDVCAKEIRVKAIDQLNKCNEHW